MEICWAQRQVWHGVPMQGEEDRTDSGSQGGEHLEEGGQTRGRARGRDHEEIAASQAHTAVRRHRERQADLRRPRAVGIAQGRGVASEFRAPGRRPLSRIRVPRVWEADGELPVVGTMDP
jgi:hypothetical protein